MQFVSYRGILPPTTGQSGPRRKLPGGVPTGDHTWAGVCHFPGGWIWSRLGRTYPVQVVFPSDAVHDDVSIRWGDHVWVFTGHFLDDGS